MDILGSVTLQEKLKSFLLKLSLEPDCRLDTLKELQAFLSEFSEDEQRNTPRSLGLKGSSASYLASTFSRLVILTQNTS